MAKLLIVQSFHRYVANPASTTAKPLPELRENFPAGKTIENASADEAEVWIANGLAEEVSAPAAYPRSESAAAT